jgi:hypothetical protein
MARMPDLKAIHESDCGVTWVIDEPMMRASHALAHDGRVWIIDPVDHPEAMEKVAALGEPAAVLQLLDRHNRDSKTVADRLGVPLVVLPDEVKSTPFQTIKVVDNPVWKEKALWWQKESCLVVAEALGSNAFYHPSPAGAGVHIGLRLKPPRQALGTYLPEHLLFGHGEPIHGPQATEALQEALDRSRRDFAGSVLGAPRAFLKG